VRLDSTDATDQSTFQSRASTDVVLVRYQGCDLKVLDGCANDSLRGSIGAYRPIDWTAGQLERVDIKSEDELFTKLPLGVAALSGAVKRGEHLHMEYFVSGTRTATRSALYRSDLPANASCKEATHFVYAFNLGAFAIANGSSFRGDVSGSYFGFGAGGNAARISSADKRGGDLTMCATEADRLRDGCRVPIRLALRAIAPGSNPDVAAGSAPETDAAANLAGRVRSDVDRERKANEHGAAAKDKRAAGDGAACLAELDKHDALDPSPSTMSTNPAGGALARIRVGCLMLAGRCDVGRDFGRKLLEADNATEVDATLDATVGEFCRSATAAPRDRYMHSLFVLENGPTKRFAISECREAATTFNAVAATVTTRRIWRPQTVTRREAACIAGAGDCALALTVFNGVRAAAQSECRKGPMGHEICPEETRWTDADAEKAFREDFSVRRTSCAAR